LNGLESSAAGTRCVHDHGDTDQADEGAGDVEAVGVNRRIHPRVSEPTVVRAHASRPLSGIPAACLLVASLDPEPDRLRSACGGRDSLLEMTRVLITGMSGTGKSTALAELARRGHQVVDADLSAWSIEVTCSNASWKIWRLWSRFCGQPRR
jgi:hypothetical protein